MMIAQFAGNQTVSEKRKQELRFDDARAGKSAVD